MAEHVKTAIGEATARVLAQAQVLQLRHARQLLQTLVRQLPRATEVERRDVWKIGDAREECVGQQRALEPRDVTIPHHTQELVPFAVAQLATWRYRVLHGIDF